VGNFTCRSSSRPQIALLVRGSLIKQAVPGAQLTGCSDAWRFAMVAMYRTPQLIDMLDAAVAAYRAAGWQDLERGYSAAVLKSPHGPEHVVIVVGRNGKGLEYHNWDGSVGPLDFEPAPPPPAGMHRPPPFWRRANLPIWVISLAMLAAGIGMLAFGTTLDVYYFVLVGALACAIGYIALATRAHRWWRVVLSAVFAVYVAASLDVALVVSARDSVHMTLIGAVVLNFVLGVRETLARKRQRGDG
jgi:hypothetical protein